MILEIRRGIAKRLVRDVVEPVFVVGSSTDCDLVLGDPQFAPIHFYLLRCDDNSTQLRCVADHPEVSVNGEVRSPIRVHEGDRIRSGSFEFHVRAA